MTELTERSFEPFVRAHRFAVIHFWAAWNPYDLKMKAMLEQDIPTELCNQIFFARFDVDPSEHWDICRQHRLLNVPFLAFYRDGRLANTLTGMRERREVIEYLSSLIS